MTEHYIGFYTSTPFWAGKKLPIEDGEICPRNLKLMSEEIFTYEPGSYKLKISKDGRFLFCIDKKVKEGLKAKYFPDVKTNTFTKWAFYLNYVNCIVLLLDSIYLTMTNFAYFETMEITNKDAFQVTIILPKNWTSG